MAEWYVNGSEFVSIFWNLPVIMQILIVIGIVLVLGLVFTGIYYLIKGICYLIYYILMGVFYLIKGIVIGFYRLCEALYYAISGKQKPIKGAKAAPLQQAPVAAPVVIIQKTVPVHNTEEVSFCPHCGVKFTERMMDNLKTKGMVYCNFCGKGFSRDGSVEIEG